MEKKIIDEAIKKGVSLKTADDMFRNIEDVLSLCIQDHIDIDPAEEYQASISAVTRQKRTVKCLIVDILLYQIVSSGNYTECMQYLRIANAISDSVDTYLENNKDV